MAEATGEFEPGVKREASVNMFLSNNDYENIISSDVKLEIPNIAADIPGVKDVSDANHFLGQTEEFDFTIE